jgi:hypothetical protein
MPLQANAATEAEKQLAIDKGLAHLAATQNGNGSWSTYGGYNPAGTAAALLAFQDHGYLAGGGTYGSNVTNGLNYLFSTATVGSGGVYWAGEDSYQTGLALTAIASTGTPSAVISGGPLNGMTHAQVAQKVVDYFVAGQVPVHHVSGGYNVSAEGWVSGGWGYGAYGTGAATRPDNSTSQWPVVGMLFAKDRLPSDITIPAGVATKLANWVAYIQNPNGGSGYSHNGDYVDESKTGGLLVELKMLGKGPGDTAVDKAIAFLNTNWKNGPSSTWYGNFGHPYAMWSIYKGLETQVGLDVTSSQYITNLHTNPGDLDNPNHGWNWWEDYCEWLVNNQNANGSWTGYTSYWGDPLSTAWDVNILLATKVQQNVVPEPLTMIGVLAGIGGLVGYVRRRRLA